MSAERQPGPWPETLTAQVAALRAAHEACQRQRDERTREEREWHEKVDEKLDTIIAQFARIPWKLFEDNGTPSIDKRVDRLEQAAKSHTFMTGRAIAVCSLLIALGSLIAAFMR